ncbi:hypothetical protein C2E23DRAFT_505679 [Lenzites betulinus]|nr:hypothetical protein C2E23DRAFT_505679 [Lenzites betulinus]
MSHQQNPAAVISEGLHVITVSTAGSRSLVRQATLANIGNLGFPILISLDATIQTLIAWIRAISPEPEHNGKPLDDNAQKKVIAEFTEFVKVYTGLMEELIEKHDVLVSENSPAAPGQGLAIGTRIRALRGQVASLVRTLRPFVPNHLAELNAQAKLAQDAADAAAALYAGPREEVSDEAAFQAAVGKLGLPAAPAQK